jgi:hypothetical protein
MLPGKSAVKVSRQIAQSSSSSAAPAVTPVAAAPVAMAATASGAEACEEAVGAAAAPVAAAAAAAVLSEPFAAAAGSAGELDVVYTALAESRRKNDPTRPLMREAAALATAVAVAAAEAAGEGVAALDADAADAFDPGVAAVPDNGVASELGADDVVELGSGVIANVSKFFQLESGTESARAAPPSLLRISNDVVPSPKVDAAFLRNVATVSLAGTDTNVASLPGQESTN